MATLYDAFGREIKPERRPPERVLASVSIWDRYSTYPSKGLTPQKLATILKEAEAGDVYRQAELFEEMEEKDLHLFSVLQSRKLAVARLDYEIQPYSESEEDRRIADFVADCIFGIEDFEDAIVDLLDAIGKGYSVLELYWDVADGKNVIRRMEWIHQKRFTWVNSTTPRLITDDSPEGVELPPWKFIFHLHKAKSGHPIRQGILRVVTWMYLFKNYSVKDWVRFGEVYGQPLRLGKYDAQATKEDKEVLLKAVQALGSDAAGIISKATEIEFVEAQKYGSINVYERFIALCNAEVSKAVLGHSAGADATPGRLGNENMAQLVREDLVRADCELLAKTIRRDIIRPLVGFNFGWDRALPFFKFRYEKPEDLNKEAERYKTLIEAGFEIPKKHGYEKFGIPQPEPGEEVIVPPQYKFGTSVMKSTCPGCGMQHVAKEKRDEKDTVDELTNALLEEAKIDPLMKPVVELLDEVGSLEELKERILDVYSHMDSETIGAVIQRALVLAELMGMAEVKDARG